ncbi:MAG TPA: OsmC family protein, partial [Methylomirabilota bacterium]|nr:OsmC family protein [Methylomirabilota bacterium]
GGPTAVETLLAALAGCVTSGIASNAAMFGVPIDSLDLELEADADFRGLLGHDKSVRSGFSDIRYTVTIQSPAPEDKVRKCKETIDRKSPVRDTIANPVNITSKFVYKPS